MTDLSSTKVRVKKPIRISNWRLRWTKFTPVGIGIQLAWQSIKRLRQLIQMLWGSMGPSYQLTLYIAVKTRVHHNSHCRMTRGSPPNWRSSRRKEITSWPSQLLWLERLDISKWIKQVTKLLNLHRNRRSPIKLLRRKVVLPLVVIRRKPIWGQSISGLIKLDSEMEMTTRRLKLEFKIHQPATSKF